MAHDEQCEIYCFDEDKVKRQQDLLEHLDVNPAIHMFKALADETRMKIAYSLCHEDELCVCDVANIIGCSLASASHHLRLLRSMELVTFRKEGKLVFYSMDNDRMRQLIKLAFAHSGNEEGAVYAR
jgi:DNA-binding transcriptional ArsR family regulator